MANKKTITNLTTRVLELNLFSESIRLMPRGHCVLDIELIEKDDVAKCQLENYQNSNKIRISECPVKTKGGKIDG